jgi:hypothetical protein
MLGINKVSQTEGWEVYPSISIEVGDHLKRISEMMYGADHEAFIDIDTLNCERILSEVEAKDAKPSGVNLIIESLLPENKVLAEAYGNWNARPAGLAKKGHGSDLHTASVGIVRSGIDLSIHPYRINTVVVHELQHLADYTSKKEMLKDSSYRLGLTMLVAGKYILKSLTTTLENKPAAYKELRKYRADKISTKRPLEKRAYSTDPEQLCRGKALISLSSTKHYEPELINL